MGPELIQDYGIIGNGRSAALVGRSGSIDWLCWPRFDSPSLFAALLDRQRGGRFEIAPAEPFTATRAYARDSNVLVTTFATRGGEVRLTDLMPVLSEEDKRRRCSPSTRSCASASAWRGDVAMRVAFQPAPRLRAPRPSRSAPRARWDSASRTARGSTRCAAIARSPRSRRATSQGRFPLRAGERATFSLSFDHAGPAVLPPLGDGAADALAAHAGVVARLGRHAAPTTGRTGEAVVRSVLALKLLAYAPSGAIVAAPTTSLPERVGGDLNWDYRFCWVRDAALTVRVALRPRLRGRGVGVLRLAAAHHAADAPGAARPLRRLRRRPGARGDARPPGRGTCGSRPVRIRNAAAGQLQLDGYGEVIEAVAEMCRRGRSLDARDADDAAPARRLRLRQLARCPTRASGSRASRPARTPTRACMCWVALDRLLQLHRAGFIAAAPRRAVRTRARRRSARRSNAKASNPTLDSYTDVLGGDTVDASLLLLDRYGYANAERPAHARQLPAAS